MASESADQALSLAVTSFVICGRTWKLGAPIYSTGVGATIKKKWSNLLAMPSPLQICDNDWRTDLTLHLQPPRLGLMFAIHKPKLRFQQHFPAGIEPSDLRCVQFFNQDDLISLLLLPSENFRTHNIVTISYNIVSSQ